MSRSFVLDTTYVSVYGALVNEFSRCESWSEAVDSSLGYSDDELMQALVSQHRHNPPWAKEDSSQAYSDRAIEFLCALQACVIAKWPRTPKKIRIIDYGGGNGYFAVWAARFMPNLDFEWMVLESAEVCDIYGREPHPAQILWLPSCELGRLDGDVFVASSSLQYIDNPAGVVEAASRSAPRLILMRLPVRLGLTADIPTVQRPGGEGVYKDANGSWPCWWFASHELDKMLDAYTTKVYRWKSTGEVKTFENVQVPMEGRLLRSKL